MLLEHLCLFGPKLLGQPDGKGGGVGALDVNCADVAPLLRNKLLDQTVNNGLHVGLQLCGLLGGGADLDGSGGAGSQVDESRAEGLADLSTELGGVGLGLGDLGATLRELDALVASLVDVLATALEGNGNGALGARLVEGLAEKSGQVCDDAVVREEDVVLAEQLALALEGRVLLLEFLNANDALDVLAEGGGEGRLGDHVLVLALRVGGDQANAQSGLASGLGVDVRVRQDDLAGLQALLVDNVLLGGEDEPDGDILGLVVVGVGEQALLLFGGRLGLDIGLDLFHEGLGSAQGLLGVELVGRRRGDLGDDGGLL